MGLSLENAKDWLNKVKQDGALPKIDFALLNASIANAGNVTRGIDLATQTPEQMEELALQAIETAPFADKAQSKEMLKAYVKSDLIPSSYEKDEKSGEEKGTHLRKFLQDTREATKGVNFEEFKKDPMGFMVRQDQNEVERITTEIRGSAHENIKDEILSKDGKKGSRTIEQDFVHSIKTNTDERSENIYKDAKADEPKPLGGGMMEMIMAFIGMLLGVNLGGLFGGKAPSGASYDERASDTSPATPEQQATVEKIEKGITFATILKDNKIDDKELGQILKGTKGQESLAAEMSAGKGNDSSSQNIILTPNAQGDNPGDTVIYAKKDPNGKLTQIQVSTTDASGEVSVKAVEGDFVLTDKNSREVGSAIMGEADKSGRTVDKNAPDVLADNISSGLSEALRQVREQSAQR